MLGDYGIILIITIYREFPAEVVLAINHKAILVVDPTTKDYLAEYDYQNVVTWGHSATSFVVVTGNLTRQTKVYFKTDQVRCICSRSIYCLATLVFTFIFILYRVKR